MTASGHDRIPKGAKMTNMTRLDGATLSDLGRAERAARALAYKLEHGAAREAVRARRRASLARKTMEEGQGVLVKNRARLAAYVASRRALEARRTADRVSRRLERVEAALARSHVRESRRGLIDLSCMQDAWA
jgi:hypothetical protein